MLSFKVKSCNSHLETLSDDDIPFFCSDFCSTMAITTAPKSRLSFLENNEITIKVKRGFCRLCSAGLPSDDLKSGTQSFHLHEVQIPVYFIILLNLLNEVPNSSCPHS